MLLTHVCLFCVDLGVEGIFRKNGNIRALKTMTDDLDKDPMSLDLSGNHPVQVAALLKKFLRDMPEPLFTFKLHRVFIATQSMFRVIASCMHWITYLYLFLPARNSRPIPPPPSPPLRHMHAPKAQS